LTFLTPSFSLPVFQAALAYVQAQPPFNVSLRPLHRTSDYTGSLANDVHAAVLWAQRDRADAYFELDPENAVQTLREVFEGIRSMNCGLHPGALSIAEGSRYIAYQLFTFDPLRSLEWMEISMDYVYVNPEFRGRGQRDRMQTCLLGAALLNVLIDERDLRVIFHEVKNPNNVERYLQAGLEPVMEQALAPASYQALYSQYAFRAHLTALGLLF